MNLNEIEFEIEEIAQEEADRIVSILNELRDSAASVTIREFLEECARDIHFLVHDDEAGDLTAAA